MSWGQYIRDANLQNRRIADLIDGGSVIWCGTSTGAVNSFELSPYPVDPNKLLLDKYLAGLRYMFIVGTANTGAATAAVYSRPRNPTLLASKSITKGPSAVPLVAGDLELDDIVVLVDMGDTFRLQSVGKSVTASGGGGATITEAEIDFGSTPVTSATITVVDAAVSGTSKIMILPSGNPATGRVGNDFEFDSINFSAVPGAGSFELAAVVNSGSVVGKRNVFYQVA